VGGFTNKTFIDAPFLCNSRPPDAAAGPDPGSVTADGCRAETLLENIAPAQHISDNNPL
jgi:hypothetical protein